MAPGFWLAPPLDTNSIPHLPIDCNRQNAQNWDFYFLDICATFLLTNCWRHVILEIRGAGLVGGTQKAPYGVFTGVSAFLVGMGPTLFQLCGLWFTFVFRTPTDHAVGSWGEVLCSSRGLLGLVSCPSRLSLRVASPSPFVSLLYHGFHHLSSTFLKKFPVLKLSLELEEPAKQEER